MSTLPHEMPPPLPGEVGVAPPTAPGALRYPERQPAWHIALGIVMLAISTGSLLLGAVAMFVIAAISSHWGDAAGWKREKISGFALFTTSSLLAVLLAVAAIFLMLRRPWAPGVLKVWAAFKIVTALGLLVWSLEQSDAEWESVVFFCILPAAWALSLPAFVLLWFMRTRVKAQIAGWGLVRGLPPDVVG